MTHADRDQAFGARPRTGEADDQAIAAEGQGREFQGRDAGEFQDRDVVVVSEARIGEAEDYGAAGDRLASDQGARDQTVRAEAQAGSPPAAAAGQRTQLLAADELEGIMTRWREIQAQFVDQPRKAVNDADALVGELMERLSRMFTSEREQLESRWRSGSDASTEDLRQGFQRYRSFFERLLAA